VAIEVIPIREVPEIVPGDDLAGILGRALSRQRVALQDDDVVVVTQKVVSKAEGRVVPEAPVGKAGWVAREARRIVARRGDLVVAETRHGFVCANAGVDASNVADGYLTLLPVDPDASAEVIRTALSASTGARIAVVITDTFGRPWRQGLVNVAIGCAGLPALVDLRGTKDGVGRVLEATVEALADEVAAASGLVMGKADGIPAAIVRGLRFEGGALPAGALVRPPGEDLFRESAMQALISWSEDGAFGPGDVAPDLVQEALLAAGSALGTGNGRSWLLVEAARGPRREALVAAAEGDAAKVIATAPVVVVLSAGPPVAPGGAYEQTHGGRDEVLLSAGAAMQNVVLAFHALGLASCWIPPSQFAASPAASGLGMVTGGELLGAIAAGRRLPE
jgi:dehydro coenzyme F420 reductase / coenzyme F420-0:L-glutamate ligase / coenzyme F420-1:gamma-L-glutamate ligase